MVRIIYWFGQKMRQRFDPHRNTHRNREKERQQYFPKLDFIVENVASMSDEDKNAFSQFLGCSPIRLDAKDVSYVSRARYFWTTFDVTNLRDLSKKDARSLLLQDEDKLKDRSLQDLLGRFGNELHPDGKLKGKTFPCLLHIATSEVQDQYGLKNQGGSNSARPFQPPTELLEHLMGFKEGYTNRGIIRTFSGDRKAEKCRKLLGNPST